jgi:hypothetical protein
MWFIEEKFHSVFEQQTLAVLGSLLGTLSWPCPNGSRFVEEKFDGVVKHGSGQLLWVKICW